MSQKSQGGAGTDQTVTPFRDVNADSAQRRIADDLRHGRLARGVEVADVARTLRIRAVYLVALEEGRFGDLPGPTYVAGFLRAYARYLELDGDELVRRYKDESGGAIARQTLNFPVPASEARHPTGFVIAAAVVVALAGAAGWYVLKDRNDIAVDLVPAVPEELAAEVPDTAVEPVPAAAEPEAADDDAPALDAEETATEGVSGGDTVDDSAEGSPEASAPEADSAALEEAAAALPAEEEVPGEAADTLEQVAEATDAGSNTGYVPRVYGRTNADSRVEIRATAETWIQVEGAGNEVLLTRVLLPGDVYHVPDRTDVTLDTGNAGGLEIRVDGVLVAPLGEPGIVIRNVSLAPDVLLAR